MPEEDITGSNKLFILEQVAERLAKAAELKVLSTSGKDAPPLRAFSGVTMKRQFHASWKNTKFITKMPY